MSKLGIPFRHFSKWSHQIGSTLSNAVSMVHNFVRNINAITPFFERHNNAVVLMSNGCTSISNLLGFRRPLAVFRGVTLVIVFSINRCVRRAFAHIRQKVLKYLPSFANFDASTSVVYECFRVWIIAPLSHPAPNIMNLSVTSFMSGFKTCRARFFKQAATRFCSAISDVCTVSINCITTITNKLPNSTASCAASRWVQSHKTTKPLPSKINRFHLSNSTTQCLAAQ